MLDLEETGGAYQVLARKYRPATFSDLIGQEPLVRTLTHAFQSGRIAHAFMLTGIRGVGKTTTARIIAKGLNCFEAEGPTMEPCGRCNSCISIAQGRHVDVLEMDAASRTGIDDIREILDGVAYKPVEARTKVYIIDEVHMLSKQAFNGLLKTLEEPPAHVKFLFATTEIRKVPVTVLSRCQRFDLRRIDGPKISDYLGVVCAKEEVGCEPQALARLARASEGSMRDALSMLDQAIAHGGSNMVTSAQVESMLGLMDEGHKVDMLEDLFHGRVAQMLHLHDQIHEAGADPVTMLGELGMLVHELTRLKIDKDLPILNQYASDVAERLSRLAGDLEIGVLVRCFDMMEKAFHEARMAEQKKAVVDMALVRIAYTAALPTPGDLARMLESGDLPAQSTPKPQDAPSQQASSAAPIIASFEEFLQVMDDKREATLRRDFERFVRPISLHPGQMEIGLGEDAPRDMASRLKAALHGWTGGNWVVAVTQTDNATMLEAREERQRQLAEKIKNSEIGQAMEAHFPGAKLIEIHELDSQQQPKAEKV